jgi:uncharacterized OB-fold protein
VRIEDEFATLLRHGSDDGGLAYPDINNPDTAHWWAACARHEYLIQQCSRCGTYRHPPRPVCFKCQSFEFAWESVPGLGTIYSYAVVVHPVHPSLVDRVPYVILVVERSAAGGEKVIGNLLGSRPEQLRIGAPVVLDWEDIGAGISLPQWRLSVDG